MHFGVDFSHATAWTRESERKEADQQRPEYAELGCLGHIVKILREWLSADAKVIKEPWDARTLTGLNLLLLPIAGRARDRLLSVAESGWLASYLNTGGGLLLFGDGDRSDIRLNAALTSATGELTLANRFAARARDGGQSHLLTYDIAGRAVAGHPAVEGVDTVHVHRGRPILTDTSTFTTLVAHNDLPLVVAATRGAGRLAVVSNAEMFALPFLGRRDNARLLLNLASWLDNRRAVHGRSQFTARYDGSDRLLRLCAVRDPMASAGDRRGGTRLIETAFAA